MKYGLTETTVKKVRAVFASFPEIEKAILYGSRAKGNFKTGSDIDLMLYGESIVPDQLSAIMLALDNLMLPYTIDLSIFDELNHAKLREHIERVGVVFYERANQCAGMKKGWQTKKLGEVCDVLDNKRRPVTQRDRISGEYPYYGATGILDYIDDYIFDEKLILIGEDGAKWDAGENTAFIADGKYWVNNHAHVIRPHRHLILDNWIVYFLYVTDLSKYITGLTVQKLNQSKLRDIEIPLPSLPEQKRLVKILDEVFQKTAKAKENAEKNLQNTRELFESYLQGVFANPGDGWKKKKLGEIYSFKNGINFDKTQKNGNGILTLDVLNMYCDGLKVNVANLYRIDKQISEDYKLKNGDILIVRSSVKEEGVAWATFFEEGNEPITFCGFIIRGRPVDKVNAEYVVYYLRSHEVRKELIKKSIKSTITNINQAILSEVNIPLPPLTEQKRIVTKLDVLSAETKKLEAIYQQKLVDIEELKKSILQKVFNGELAGAQL